MGQSTESKEPSICIISESTTTLQCDDDDHSLTMEPIETPQDITIHEVHEVAPSPDQTQNGLNELNPKQNELNLKQNGLNPKQNRKAQSHQNVMDLTTTSTPNPPSTDEDAGDSDS